MRKSHYLFAVLLWMHSTLLIAATRDGRWHLGIGDPSIWGWVTVGVYLLAVGCCYYQANAHKLPKQKLSGQSRKFWWLLGAFLLLLAINKQLDLQT